MDYKDMVLKLVTAAADVSRLSQNTTVDDFLSAAEKIVDVLSPSKDDGQYQMYTIIELARKALVKEDAGN